MKKIFAAFAALSLMALSTTANAQAILDGGSSGDNRIGIQLGMNMPTFGESTFGGTMGWNFGLTGLKSTESFIPNSYLRASILYSRKGASSDLTEVGKYKFKNATYKLHYLEVPVRFGYAYEANDLVCIMAETGPYFAFRLNNSQRNDEAYENDISIGNGNGAMSDYYDVRHFDVGWGLHAGVLFAKKYQVMAGYDWGMCKVAPETGSNRNFSVNLCVFFD